MDKVTRMAVVVMLIALAALTGWGAGQTSSSRASRVLAPAPAASTSDMPKLKFSNKLSKLPLPKVLQTEDYYLDKCEIDNFRTVAPYVPDFICEKARLPYAERIKFFYSLKKSEIQKALIGRFGEAAMRKPVEGIALVDRVWFLCCDVLIYGQPVLTLPAKAANFREAVNICGMTQLSKWMDIQKAKNLYLKDIIPQGYDEATALQQRDFAGGFGRVYNPFDYDRAIGIRPEKPIQSFCPYSASEFSHLQVGKKEWLMEMFRRMPDRIREARALNASELYRIYNEIKADKTGYEYVRKNSSSPLAKEGSINLQKLCLEMVTYKRPLMLLCAEKYSLKQVIYACRFEYAEEFYRSQKEGKKREKIEKKEEDIYNWEANALVALGKEYHNREWIKFGDDMLKAPPPVRVIGCGQKQNQEPLVDMLAQYPKEDVARLSAKERKELTELMALLPEKVVQASDLSTGRIYDLYSEIKADKTGYSYIQKQNPQLSKEKAEKVQQLAMEMVIYRRPLALLRAENYTLEQVINVCQFKYVETAYKMKQKGKKLKRSTPEHIRVYNLQANALKVLGEKYNHPDWVKFGQEMYEDGQKCEVAKHDDSQMIQNQVAKVSDAPRVRNQDDTQSQSKSDQKADSPRAQNQ